MGLKGWAWWEKQGNGKEFPSKGIGSTGGISGVGQIGSSGDSQTGRWNTSGNSGLDVLGLDLDKVDTIEDVASVVLSC